jgi:hypothetical protein
MLCAEKLIAAKLREADERRFAPPQRPLGGDASPGEKPNLSRRAFAAICENGVSQRPK